MRERLAFLGTPLRLSAQAREARALITGFAPLPYIWYRARAREA